MKIQLILAGNYTSCQKTLNIWSNACQQYNLPLQSIELESATGKEIAGALGLKTFPALIVDNKIHAIGHPDPNDALKLISHLSKSS